MSWNEVAEIIGGEIEKNGRCSSETAWTLAGHLVLKLEIPGLKKKSNSNLDITAAVKVIPELAKFESKRGRGQGIVLKSSVVKTEAVENKVPEQIKTVVETPIAVISDSVLIAAPVAKPVRIIDSEDSGPSQMPGSLLGNADDPNRPRLLPDNFGDWIKKPKIEEVKSDVLYFRNEKYEIPRINPIRGTAQQNQIINIIVLVFGGIECQGGQIKFLEKEYLLPEENMKMFYDAIWYMFCAKHIIDGTVRITS